MKIRKAAQRWKAGSTIGIPTLPAVVRTRNGATFNPSADLWQYMDGVEKVRVDFAQLRPHLAPEILNVYKAVAMHLTTELGSATIVNLLLNTNRFIKWLPKSGPLTEFVEDHFRSLWSATGPMGAYGAKRPIRTLFLRWHEHRYPGIDDGSIRYLKTRKIRAPSTNEAVLTWDPVRGPFTDTEYQGLYDALLEAYGEGLVQDRYFLCSWLSMAFGLRPKQIALLKVCDVKRIQEGTSISYSIAIPRIKQPGQESRDEMDDWGVIEEIGELLLSHAQATKALFGSLIPNPDAAPLFHSLDDEGGYSESVPDIQGIDDDETDEEQDEGEDGGDDDKREVSGAILGAGYEYHNRPKTIGRWIQYAFARVDVCSERVGLAMTITASRFRKSFGTRLAKNGVSPAVLSKLMGHADIRSSDPYLAITSGLHQRLNRALSFELAPIAQAFKGELMVDWDESDSAPTIRDFRIAPDKDIGKCGKHGFCGFAAPIACYTCKKFRPWVDGPHEAVFDYLWNKRDRRAEGPSGQEMVTLHDRTILAVARVILLCKEVNDVEQRLE